MTHDTKGQDMAINVGMLEFSEKLGGDYTLDMGSPESAVDHIRRLLIQDAVPADERDGATHIYWAPSGNVYLVKSSGHTVNGSRDVMVVRAVKRESRGLPLGQRLRVSLRELDRLG